MSGALASFLEIQEITEDNVFEYADLLGEDMAENLERTFYRGLAVVSEDSRQPLAMMIWELKNSEREDLDNVNSIEWLMISENEAGERLFEEYGERAAKEKVKRSSFSIPAKPGNPEKALLKQLGFTAKLTEGNHIVVKVGEFSKLPLMKNRKKDPSIAPLKDATTRMFRKGIYRCVSMNFYGICEDLSYLPMSWFEPDVSCFSVKEDTINGFLLFHRQPSGCLSLQLLAAMGKDYQKTLVGLMRQAILSMEEYYPPETRVILDRHNQATLLLSEKLFPRGFGSPVYYGEREEIQEEL